MFSRPKRRFLFHCAASVGLTCGAITAHAEINYHVAVKPGDKQIAIEIKVPSKGGDLSVQIANWMPGAYTYGNFYENVHDVSAMDSKGTALEVTHPDKNTWSVNTKSGGPVTFKYWLPTGGQRRFAQTQDDSFVQISGAPSYMYVVGRKLEKCKIKFDVPEGWKLATGLDETSGGPNAFSAPTYDVLADNPVSTGNFILDHYTLRGKEHYIVLEGAAKDQVNREKLLHDCRFVSASETDFFGGAPYHKYVWHFIVYPGADGGGGLEHLASTQISLSSGEGPRAQSVLAHEYFHLWNVKRIRAKVLGPFDYLTLPKTGSLWWLEGVTDYYANLLPFRYGLWDKSQLFEGIQRNYATIESNPAHTTIGPNEASMRVAEANNGRGNSNGYLISYYNLGWLAGLCLDTEIRTQSKGKHSLDDVIHALWALCKNDQPGFEEDEIRKQCIRFGGDAMGPFYDRVVMQAGKMDVDGQLQKMGLQFGSKSESYVDIGFTAMRSREAGGFRISGVREAAKGQLQEGDILLSINGRSLEGSDARAAQGVLAEEQRKVAVGTLVTVEVKRGETTMKVQISPLQASRMVRTVLDMPSASKEALDLQHGWLITKKPSVP